MAMPNPFASPEFSMTSLTAAVNKIPNMYGRLNELNLMPTQGVITRTVTIEEYNGVLTLLPTLPVGAPGTTAKSGKRKVRSFVIPHIPHDDVILPDEVQGVREFGSENGLMTQASVLARKLGTMRNRHAITLENLRMGALKGLITDADGSTLYNLYSEFEVSQTTVDFVLGTGTTDVRGKCLDVKRAIEDNLLGEVMTSVHALVSQEFFDKLTKHPEVKAAYANWSSNETLRSDPRAGFQFGGITFEEYRGIATNTGGTTTRFIAANEGYAFPLGTLNAFATYFAPADFNEAVNTLGLELYAKQEERQHGRGWDLHTQSNPLPLCHRPAVVVKLTTSN